MTARRKPAAHLDASRLISEQQHDDQEGALLVFAKHTVPPSVGQFLIDLDLLLDLVCLNGCQSFWSRPGQLKYLFFSHKMLGVALVVVDLSKHSDALFVPAVEEKPSWRLGHERQTKEGAHGEKQLEDERQTVGKVGLPVEHCMGKVNAQAIRWNETRLRHRSKQPRKNSECSSFAWPIPSAYDHIAFANIRTLSSAKTHHLPKVIPGPTLPPRAPRYVAGAASVW
jgi:hypothetical protein